MSPLDERFIREGLKKAFASVAEGGVHLFACPAEAEGEVIFRISLPTRDGRGRPSFLN